MKSLKIILLIFFGIACNTAKSQDYAGKDFWLAFIDNGGCTPTPYPYLPMPNPAPPIYWYDTTELFLSSKYNATVYVHIEKGIMGDNGPSEEFSDTIYLQPNRTKRVLLPVQLMCRYDYAFDVFNNGVHVWSDTPIYVQSSNLLKTRKGATSVLPSSSIPFAPEYIVTTNESTSYDTCMRIAKYNDQTCSEFVIVGIADESLVEIFATAATTYPQSRKLKPVIVKIRKGETFLYIANADSINKLYNLTGTSIRSKTANSKFAVFAGNKRTRSLLADNSNVICGKSDPIDHVYEQLRPIDHWGKSYHVAPFYKNPGGYFIRIVAKESNTQIKINNGSPFTLNAGGLYVYNAFKDSGTTIKANKPISVSQFTKGKTCSKYPNNIAKGNISMTYIMADEQPIKETLVNSVDYVDYSITDSNYFHESYLNIITKTADTSYFRVDNKHLPNANWYNQSTMSGFSYAYLKLDSIANLLTSSKGFWAYMYGYAFSEGFSTTMGGGAKILNQNFIFTRTCKKDTTIFTAIRTDSIDNITWRIDNAPTLYSGNSFTKVFPDTGYHEIYMYFRHKNTNVYDTISKRIYVDFADETPVLINDTLVCGHIGFTLLAKNLDWFKRYEWNGGHDAFGQYIKNPGLYWLRVTERNGCRFQDTLMVYNTPSPVASFIQADTQICSNFNHPIRFVNNSTSKDSIINTSWDFDDFNPFDTMADTVYHKFPKVGQYLIKFKVKTYKGCEDDTFGFFEIKQAPKAFYTITNKDSCFKTNTVTYTNTTIKDTSLHRRFKWYFSEGYVISNNNPPAPRKYSAEGKYYTLLIYENSNGCIDTMRKNIEIFKEPNVDFNASQPVACMGDTVKLINSTTALNSPIRYNWTIVSKKDTAKNTFYIYPNKGFYSVKLKATIPQGCKDSITKIVKVSGNVKADFTINDTQQCDYGNNFKFKNTSTSDTGKIQTSTWMMSDGYTEENSDSLRHSFGLPGAKFAWLKVVNEFGCRDSVKKTFSVLPNEKADIVVNDASQCSKSQSFNFHLKQSTGSSSVKWYFNSDSLLMPQVNGLKFANNGWQTVRVINLGASNCPGFDTILVNINPNPKANFTCSDSQMCLSNNQFVFANASSIANGSIASQLWRFSDGSTSNAVNPLPKKYLDSGTYLVQLICNSDSMCSDTAMQNVQVESSVRLQIADIKTVCLNDSTKVLATLLNGSPIPSYAMWDMGDGAYASGLNASHQYQNIGQYKVKLYTSTVGGCKDTFNASSNAYVLKLPNVNFTYNFKDGGNSNTLATFKNSVTNYKYLLWDFAQFGQSIKNDSTITVYDSTTILVKLKITDFNGCSNTKEEWVYIGGPIKYYTPNVFTPNGDGKNEMFGPEGIEFARNYTFKIYNRWGEIVFATDNHLDKWDGYYRGKLCQNGVYTYVISFRDFFYKYSEQSGTFLLKW